MNDTTQEQEQGASEETVSRLGPGRRLRETREAKGMTRPQAAGELHLHENIVQALEEDDYDNLPPPTFVVGYLKNYARLLGLPSDEIVASYDDRDQAPPLVSTVQSDQQVRSGDLPVRLMTYLVVLGLVALLVMWWLPQSGFRPFFQGEEGVSQSEASAPETPAARAPGLAELQEPAAPSGFEPVPEPPPLPDDAAEPAAEAPATAEPAPVEPPPEASVAAPEPEVEPQVESEPPAPQAQAPEPAPATEVVDEEAGVSVRLEFEADSWTQIVDADGERLLADLVRGGETRTVRGKAPFRVSLGYAPGVTVHYQGEVFDHTPYQRKRVARFTLGEAADNRE